MTDFEKAMAEIWIKEFEILKSKELCEIFYSLIDKIKEKIKN